MRPGEIVPLSFHGGLVALSFLVAVLGSYVAMLAAAGIRAETRDGEIRIGYILIGAIAMGGASPPPRAPAARSPPCPGRAGIPARLFTAVR